MRYVRSTKEDYKMRYKEYKWGADTFISRRDTDKDPVEELINDIAMHNNIQKFMEDIQWDIA